MITILKVLLVRKLKASLKSSTIGVAGLLMLSAAWITTHPELASAIAPKWGGTIVACAGLLVAVARARSL